MRNENKVNNSSVKISLFVFLLFFLSLFVFSQSVFSLESYRILNQNGNFSVLLENISKSVYGDNLLVEYSFKVKNNLNKEYWINLSSENISGWDIFINNGFFKLKPYETKEVVVKCKANKDFNYATDVISSDTIVISQKSNFKGSVIFPIKVDSGSESVSIKFKLYIRERGKKEVSFNIKFSTEDISPVNPLKFFVEGRDIKGEIPVSIILEFADLRFVYDDKFNDVNSNHIYTQSINQSVSPGRYLAKVTVRYKRDDSNMVLEWYNYSYLRVVPFRNIIVDRVVHDGLFSDTLIFKVRNNGNVKDQFESSFNSSYFKNLFLSSNINYTYNDGIISFKLDLEKGESEEIVFIYNYIFLYLFSFLVLGLVVYVYIRKSSNPLDVEVNLYDIKRVKYEGVKQVKIKIGFENMKNVVVENLSIVFRMPKYLNVKENSFLLTKPNNVLKGRNQYKLVWNFKNFDKNESRILGFTVINSRGILGDIHIPPLEIEVKINGRIRKYYKSIPIIKG